MVSLGLGRGLGFRVSVRVGLRAGLGLYFRATVRVRVTVFHCRPCSSGQ